MNSSAFEVAFAVLRAEIGIDDIKVGNADFVIRLFQMKSVVDGDICFAAAVMTCEKSYSFMFHILKNCYPVELIFNGAALDACNGIVEFLADFTDVAAVDGHNVILIAELTDG